MCPTISPYTTSVCLYLSPFSFFFFHALTAWCVSPRTATVLFSKQLLLGWTKRDQLLPVPIAARTCWVLMRRPTAILIRERVRNIFFRLQGSPWFHGPCPCPEPLRSRSCASNEVKMRNSHLAIAKHRRDSWWASQLRYVLNARTIQTLQVKWMSKMVGGWAIHIKDFKQIIKKQMQTYDFWEGRQTISLKHLETSQSIIHGAQTQFFSAIIFSKPTHL